MTGIHYNNSLMPHVFQLLYHFAFTVDQVTLIVSLSTPSQQYMAKRITLHKI